jgi:hypothetical protein
MQLQMSDDNLPARWVAWLRSHVARVEQEVVRKPRDPEQGPEPSSPY